MSKPLAIDLFCGLGGFTDGLLAEGFDCIGFDIERHDYGTGGYPAQLVLQDVLTLHGRQFRDASLILASPPCQFFSYCAMPWSRAKQLERDVRADPERTRQATALFDACFRIQREACEAAGHHVPMVIENVRGANPWVKEQFGRSRWNYGSFHLWGDVPALMPMTKTRAVKGIPHRTSKHWTNPAEHEIAKMCDCGHTANEHDIGSDAPCSKCSCINPVYRKANGFNVASARQFGHLFDGAKYERTTDDKRQDIGIKRKAASAMIAKIPLALSRYIARVYKPIEMQKAA